MAEALTKPQPQWLSGSLFHFSLFLRQNF
jgi:hypothetical protein